MKFVTLTELFYDPIRIFEFDGDEIVESKLMIVHDKSVAISAAPSEFSISNHPIPAVSPIYKKSRRSN
jgi:hypothetical protein